MVSENGKTCWAFWNCNGAVKENCPAFKSNSGDRCWEVADIYQKNGCPKLKNTYKICWECEWFRKKNPDFERLIKVKPLP